MTGIEILSTPYLLQMHFSNKVCDVCALQERKRLDQRLENALTDQLDPIDWATYEPHLWSNAERYQQRVALLFGLLAPRLAEVSLGLGVGRGDIGRAAAAKAGGAAC